MSGSSARHASSAATIACIEGNLSSGFLAIAHATTESRRAETSGLRSRTLGTGSLTCFIAIAIRLPPE